MARSLRWVGASVLAAVLTVAGSVLAPASQGAVTAPVLNSFSAPSSGHASFTMRTDACVKATEIGVAARTSTSAWADYPGTVYAAPGSGVNLCPESYTFVSDAKTFGPGTYRVYPFWRTADGVWHFFPARVLTVPAAGAVQPTWAPTGSRALTFDDEFNGTSLDTARWTSGWGAVSGTTPPVNPAEQQCYASGQVTESGGVLHLAAVAASTSCGSVHPYRSGIITSDPSVLGAGHGFAQSHGSVEWRAWLPADSSGACADWPALWSDGQSWPHDGEIDAMECLGDPASTGSGTAQWHLHSDAAGSAASGPGGGPVGHVAGWHTFGYQWTTSSVAFYYDGHSVGSAPYTVAAPNYLIANLAVGAYGGRTAAPAAMMIDWVHAWSQ